MESHNYGGNLTVYLDRLFRQDGGFTTYLGVSDAPFDRNKTFHKLRVRDDYDDHSDMYVRTSDSNIEWVHNTDNNQVVHIPRGFEAATFKDSDFVIDGCNPIFDLASTATPKKSTVSAGRSISMNVRNTLRAVHKAARLAMRGEAAVMF